ncbi:AAA family ATPase [Sphaerimonospora thailandensis]|uniref:ATPase AAA n=1 Tax=Sphaerimonospora thailandensis TaxID=795644 RepID=A0A8J3W1F1_9ACTN|nr:ATP-binding protein [Sphaerimonospora thailandensis]GIH72125.1 ATPase AAA [Sphaerimonospora thailandensis]
MAEQLGKPTRVLDRDREWALLREFMEDPAPQLRVAIVSGRRRNGKSFLLEALTEAAGGLYLAAVQEEGRVLALQRFSEAVAEHAGVRAGALRLEGWEEVLTTALDVVNRAPGAPLLVIDELPYLLQHSPEIPGLLQLLYDRSQSGKAPGGRIVLCGSAMSVMNELLSGTKPLRGRAMLDLRLQAFDYRTAREHWHVDDPEVALLVNACVGGAPGYRPLAPGGSPQSTAEFDDWIQRTLLDPGRALYSRVEAEFLLREDPRITHRTLYYDLLSAVAQGASTPARIGGLLERQRSTVIAPLEVLESAGYLHKAQDLLKARNPVITVADPVIRFNQLITLPLVDMVEHGRARQAWQESRPTFHSRILGPHFEDLVRRWARAFAPDETALRIGVVGSTEVPDPAAKTKHEVDVLALAPGERPQSAHARITLIGEAKATIQPRGVRDVGRLEHIRDLLAGLGHHTEDASLVLCSLHGFHPDVQQAAARRRDLLLVDLAALYGDGPVRGGQ